MKRLVDLAVGTARLPLLLGVMAWTAYSLRQALPPPRQGLQV